MTRPPSLHCPECGADILEAQHRGRYDNDGNYIEHRDGCRCPWCNWMWSDDDPPERCKCGALVGVSCDDEHAYPKTIREVTE